jgi:hypothetical protein
MSWSALASQFCLELAFGVYFALAFVAPAPVGRFFYRMMATVAVIPLVLSILGLRLANEAAWREPAVWAALFALGAYPIVSGPMRGWRWGAALGWSLVWTGVALTAIVVRESEVVRNQSIGTSLVSAASAMATGAVVGTVGVAMVLGHWYLTVPTLAIRHLQRLNRVTVATMIACAVLVASTCVMQARELDAAEQPLMAPFGLFCLGTRLFAGLMLPMLFSWMAASALRFNNTRSATGILYASTILVLIGAAVSISLQDTYGIPL